MKNLIFSLLLLCFMACSTTNNTLPVGSTWLFQLNLGEKGMLPVQVEVKENNVLVFKNAEEEIEVTDVRYQADSVFIKMPVFGSEFKGKLDGETVTGNWHNYNKTNYSIPFTARQGKQPRFALNSIENSTNFSGRYKVTFADKEGNETAAIGIFNQNEAGTVTGTFLTETGDYRYLEGNAAGNTMSLSAFDGAHAFLFTAKENEGKLYGKFFSGTHWEEKWTAEKDNSIKLTDADELTYLLPGYKTVSFEFPDENGQVLSFPNASYDGKVVMLQILGTWCPNCMDETMYYTKLYDAYQNDGLEIIALDFEPTPTLDYFKPRAERFKKDLGVKYPVLLAGPSNKKEAVKSLPMLNHILSYPTTIFIGKDGTVRKIHTGFSGPGTGDTYTRYVEKTDKLIKSLLEE